MFCYFLIAQKVTKKGTLPNASTHKANAPSLGKEASALFSLINAEYFALNIVNQLITL
jgi:hypothetical protein